MPCSGQLNVWLSVSGWSWLCASCREQQLEERKARLAEALEKERHLDMQMELDRRAALEMYEVGGAGG